MVFFLVFSGWALLIDSIVRKGMLPRGKTHIWPLRRQVLYYVGIIGSIYFVMESEVLGVELVYCVGMGLWPICGARPFEASNDE